MKIRMARIAGLALTAILVLGMGLTAQAKKEKVGVLNKGVFTDNRFGFSITMPKEWRDGGLRDEYSPERISFLYKRTRVPARLRDNPEEALRPIVMVFADSNTLPTAAFVDSLRSGLTKDSFRDKILNKSVFFQRGAPNPAEQLRVQNVKIGGRDAVQYQMRREYAVQVQPEGRSVPELVREFRSGWVYLIPLEGALVYMELVCERQFENELQPEFEAFINSVTFDQAAGDSTAAPLESGE